MRKALVITMFLLLVGVPMARSQAVDYFQAPSVYQALDRARSQDKLLLVEFSAPWNYKSRWMNQMINSSEAICDTLNNHFVVFRIDTASPHGSSLAQTYKVTDYPYLLIFDGNGTVVDLLSQTTDEQGFLEFLDINPEQLSADVRWRVSQIVDAARMLDWETVDELFSDLELRHAQELTQEHFWEIFNESTINRYGSAPFAFFTRNIEEFKTNIDSTEVEDLFFVICKNRLFEYIISDRTYDSLELEELWITVQNADVQLQTLTEIYQMVLARHSGDIDSYLLSYQSALGMLAEEEGFKLAISLDFIARLGSKEQKAIARKLISTQIAQTKIASQNQMLMNIRSKF